MIRILLVLIYDHILFMFNFIRKRSYENPSDRIRMVKTIVPYAILAVVFKIWILAKVIMLLLGLALIIRPIIVCLMIFGFLRSKIEWRLLLTLTFYGIAEAVFCILLSKWLIYVIFALSLSITILGVVIFVLSMLIFGVKCLFRKA